MGIAPLRQGQPVGQLYAALQLRAGAAERLKDLVLQRLTHAGTPEKYWFAC